MTQDDLDIGLLATIARDAEVFKTMGEERVTKLIIDYVPPRCAMFIPRINPNEGPINIHPSESVEITYVLDSAMFGGDIWAALTCGARVIVNPFRWWNYDTLSKQTINI